MKRILLVTLLLAGCGSNNHSSSDEATVSDPLVGTWKAPCADNGIEEHKYSGGINYTTITLFSDADCTHSVGALSAQSNYSIHGNALNTTIKEIQMVVTDQTVVDEFNSGSLYGFSDWELNVSKDLAGKDIFPAVGATHYNIFKISGSKLQLGDTSGTDDGTSKDLRPTSYDGVVYTRI